MGIIETTRLNGYAPGMAGELYYINYHDIAPVVETQYLSRSNTELIAMIPHKHPADQPELCSSVTCPIAQYVTGDLDAPEIVGMLLEKRVDLGHSTHEIGLLQTTQGFVVVHNYSSDGCCEQCEELDTNHYVAYTAQEALDLFYLDSISSLETAVREEANRVGLS